MSSESQATTVGSEEDLGEPAREDDQIHPGHSQWPSVTQNIIVISLLFPFFFLSNPGPIILYPCHYQTH